MEENFRTQRWQQSSNGVRTIPKTKIGSDKKLKPTPSWAVINFNKSQSDSFGNLWWLTRKINKFRNENDSQIAQSHVITISTSIPQNAVELHSILLIPFVRHDNVDVNVSMAYQSMMMNPQAERVTRTLIDKFQSQIQNSRTWSNSSETYLRFFTINLLLWGCWLSSTINIPPVGFQFQFRSVSAYQFAVI